MVDNLVGKTLLNQFRVDAFIAAGGMSNVYRAWDLVRNIPLAMKVISPDIANNSLIIQGFRQEAEILSRLTHPNIIASYGIHEDGESIFILQAFVDGINLREFLKSHEILDIDVATLYMDQLCSALEFAHKMGVIHGDLKPSNVLLDG